MNFLRWTTLSILTLLSSINLLEASVVIDFNELPLGPSSASGSYFDGYGASASIGSWTSQGATFNTHPFSPGWSYSNVNNSTSAGFTNQWAAFPGTGFGGSGNYALAAGFFANDVYINLPNDQRIDSLRITNATYPALSMRDGDGFAKKFGGESGNDPDFFKVTITGFSNSNATGSITGSTDFYLADYRFNNNALDYIVNDWQLLSLAPLGNATSIGLTFSGSDNGDFGLNTPAYLAIDDLTFSVVPEPNSFALLSTIGLVTIFRRRKYRVVNRLKLFGCIA